MKLLAISLLIILSTGCAIRHVHSYDDVESSYRTALVRNLTTTDWMGVYHAEKDPVEQKKIRNQVLEELIWLSDFEFNRYEIRFSNGRATLDTAAEWASLALTGATAVVSAPQTLGAIATGIQGGKATLDKNLYDQQTRSAVLLEMEALRKTQLINVATGEGLPVNEYSLERGLIDIQRYVNSGTVHAALAEIAHTASGQQTHAESTLSTLHRH